MAIRPTMADLIDGLYLGHFHVTTVWPDPAATEAVKDALLVTGPLAHAGRVWRVDGGRVVVNYRWVLTPVLRPRTDAEIAAECGIPTAADTPIPE